MAKRIVVANHLKRLRPILQRMIFVPTNGPTDRTCADATSTGASVRAIPEMGIGFRWVVQDDGDADRKRIGPKLGTSFKMKKRVRSGRYVGNERE